MATRPTTTAAAPGRLGPARNAVPLKATGFVALLGFLLAAFGMAAGAAGEEATENDAADAYRDAWGPPVGDAVLPLAAEDQHGNLRDLAGLSGARGLLLLINRSAVW